MKDNDFPLWIFFQENDYMSDPDIYDVAERQYLEHAENLTHKNND